MLLPSVSGWEHFTLYTTLIQESCTRGSDSGELCYKYVFWCFSQKWTKIFCENAFLHRIHCNIFQFPRKSMNCQNILNSIFYLVITLFCTFFQSPSGELSQIASPGMTRARVNSQNVRDNKLIFLSMSILLVWIPSLNRVTRPKVTVHCH